jgi:plasmid stabilization system protein ParE
MVIKWAPTANAGVKGIYQFYSNVGESVARKLIYELKSETNRLAQFPYMGHVVPSLDETSGMFRSLVVVNGLFRIVYAVDEDANQVVIIAAYSCRQHPDVVNAFVEQFLLDSKKT